MSRRRLRIIENNGYSPWIVGFVLVVVVATILLRSSAYAFSANIFRFENGKVVEIWKHRDDFGLTEQIESPISAREARAE
jgi:hypothetical protein